MPRTCPTIAFAATDRVYLFAGVDVDVETNPKTGDFEKDFRSGLPEISRRDEHSGLKGIEPKQLQSEREKGRKDKNSGKGTGGGTASKSGGSRA